MNFSKPSSTQISETLACIVVGVIFAMLLIYIIRELHSVKSYVNDSKRYNASLKTQVILLRKEVEAGNEIIAEGNETIKVINRRISRR